MQWDAELFTDPAGAAFALGNRAAKCSVLSAPQRGLTQLPSIGVVPEYYTFKLVNMLLQNF